MAPFPEPATAMIPLPAEDITSRVALALAEDVGDGDRTADILPADSRAEARIISREQAVICGRAWVEETFRQLDPAVTLQWAVRDGDEVDAGTELCRLQGPTRALLTGERTALNFLQALSGTATVARSYARLVEGTGAALLDTRKTVPGLRSAQKYAVVCGGGSNHRQGLFDAILIKENHIAACGSIEAAVRRARELHPEILVEVEVETLAQLDEAIAAAADVAMLDNFDLDRMRTAVRRPRGRLKLEASGGFDHDSVREVAATGVDYVSVGAITKHVRAVDLSMRVITGP